MRNFIATTFLFLFTLFSFSTFATTYYLSSSNGNDNNSGTDPSSAWQSLDKLNSANLRPGDNVLFMRGDTFYGSIVVDNSNITYGAFGSGAKPIITGFTNVTSWTNLGGNVWESTNAVSQLRTANTVVINGVNTAMGRYPNSGYLTYQSHNGNTSITTNALNGANWTGAGIAIKKQNWYIESGSITSQYGGTLNYSDPGLYTPTNGFGFFIENDPRTLDVQNEWYYNPSTKKLRVYSASRPDNVQITTVEELFSNPGNNPFITITDLSFMGSNSHMIDFYYGRNETVKNCDLSFAGINGIIVDGLNADFENNNISDIGGIGIRVNKSNAVIKNNTLNRIGVIAGNARPDADAGIFCNSENAIIQGNVLDTLGHSGIVFYGSNSVVRNNFINYSCLVLDDGGGICTHGGYVGQQIIGNIVLNSIGAPEGTQGPTNILAHGIFLDDLSNSVTVSNNSVAGCRGVGIDLHRASNININGNTCFDNGVKGNWMKGQIMFQCGPNTPFTGIKMNNNIFFGKTVDQLALFCYASPISDYDVPHFGTMDNNYYGRPIKDQNTILVTGNYYDVPGWQSYMKQDSHSKGSPKSITNLNDLRFEYNATSSSKTIQLDGNYIDAKNVSYNGSITLAPYTSAVLIRNGAIQNKGPKASAGSNQTITLPSNSVSLNGTGTDPDGNIVSYQWSKSSGPSDGSIDNPSSASTTVTGLSEGSYQFTLNVTDNAGASASDAITITVKAASNNSITADAGPDQIINLPTNTATLNGSGNGGTISSYNWTKISGPSSGTITDANSATTTVEDLEEGDYHFQLKVTDNNGITNTSDVEITVNGSDDLLPAVNPVNTENGIVYAYYEDDKYSQVPDFSQLTPVKTGTTPGFDLSVADRSDKFAVNFNGYIDVPSDGQYTFYTTSDDGSLLYIDNQLVVNNDGIHSAVENSGTIGLKAGKHAISVGFFEYTGDQVLDVSYSGPGISKQAVPSSVLYSRSADLLPALNPGNTVNGVVYKYYEGNYNQVPDFANLQPVKTGIVSDFDLSVANRADNFAIHYDSYIDVPEDGVYTFYMSSDDGSTLNIDNVRVVDNDGVHGNQEKAGTIGLKAGKHSISIGYFEQKGNEILNVSYSGPGISKQIIPSSSLFKISSNNTMARMADNSMTVNNAYMSTTPPHKDGLNALNALKVGVKAYPNPFVNSIVLSITGEAGSYRLFLIDALGRTVWTATGNKDAGTYNQTINTSSIQKGIYFLKVVQNNNNSSVIKLEK